MVTGEFTGAASKEFSRARGDSSAQSKIKEREVFEIFDLLESRRFRVREVATIYGISGSGSV